MKKGAQHSPEAIRQMKKSRLKVWQRPGFREKMAARMKQAHIEHSATFRAAAKSRWTAEERAKQSQRLLGKLKGLGLDRETANRKQQRIEVFRAAADIESGACRLNKLGFKQDADAMFTVVRNLRSYAEKNL